MFLPRCRSRRSRARSRRCGRSSTPRTSTRRRSRSRRSRSNAAKYPKAVAKIVDDAEMLLEFYRYPAEHWIHLRTTNPIESTFATVRLRTRVTKGPGSRAAGVAMAYKLIEAAQARWRVVNAPHLVALVRTGAVFHHGKLLERPVDITPTAPAESGETDVA
jgi:putative transposase